VRLAAPVVTAQVGIMTLGVIDTAMVGHVSKDALSAVALGNYYSFGLLVLGMGIVMALDPVIAQAVGARDDEATALSFQRGVVLSLVLAPPFIAAFFAAGPILRLLGQPPELIPVAAAFVRAMVPGLPAFFLFICLRQTLQAMSIVRPVLIAVILANGANAFLDWVLVYGHLGMPALGAVGSGIGTTICRYFMLAVLCAASRGELRRFLRRPSREALAIRPLARLFGIGLSIGLQMGLEFWSFLVVLLIMGRFGIAVLSGHQIAMNLASLSFMVPVGIGAAAATRVGNAIGAGDSEAALRSALTAEALGAAAMLVSAFFFALFPRALAGLFTGDREAVAWATAFLPIAAIFQIFDGTQAVGCGVLRGAGDSRAAAVINFIGYWVLGLPLGLLLTYTLGWGPKGLWWGQTVALACVAVLLVARIRARLGRPISRVTIEASTSRAA
jgi:MATE family multidrug resistance protein